AVIVPALRCVALPVPAGPHPLSLHDALPICAPHRGEHLQRADRSVSGRVAIEAEDVPGVLAAVAPAPLAQHLEHVAIADARPRADRKSTRLNSSHVKISYAVLCLQKTIHKTR